MKKNITNMFLLLIIMLILTACSGNTGDSDKYSQESIDKTSPIDNNTQDSTRPSSSDALVETPDSQNDNFSQKNDEEYLSDTSNIKIISSAYDSIWVKEDTDDGESYIVHIDVDGKILDKMNWIDNICDFGNGTDGSLYIVKDKNTDYFKIYDAALQKEVTNEFVNDSEYIISCIQTEDKYVLVTRKISDTFEEKYASLRLIDTSKQELFSIQLDKTTLSDNYNMGSNISPETINFGYAGNNIFYLAYISSLYEDEVNSLVIDLNRNSVMPVTFPQKNGELYCTSDGEHSIMYSMTHGMVCLNHNTGVYFDYTIDDDYYPTGPLSSNGLFFASKEPAFSSQTFMAFIDWPGNVAIDLNQYSRPVINAQPFINGKSLIQFAGNYVTFIDENGEFLFEPIQGCARIESFYPYKNVGIIDIIDENDNLISTMEMDDNGNTSPLKIPMAQNYSYILIESNNKLYWISDANSTFQVQESSFSK